MAISLSRWQPIDGWQRYPQLFGGSAALTGVGLLLCHLWDLPEKGMVSVFLAAAALASWFRFLLDENRDAIWMFRVAPDRANVRTALSVLTMFLGIFVAFCLGAAWLGEGELASGYSFIFRSARLSSASILQRDFGGFAPILVHNGAVMMAFFSLAFVYHTYGALLSIAWNCAAWALVLVVLVSRGAHASSLPAPVFVVLASLALLPHLVLEATAYVATTLASVFLSRALLKYGVRDLRIRQVAGAVAQILLLALVLLVAAAAVESTLPGFAMERLR